MHDFVDINEYTQAVVTELEQTHTWTRKLPRALLIHLMNDVKASPTKAAFIIASSYITIRPKQPTPKLAEKLPEECQKRCHVTKEQIHATVTNIITTGEKIFLEISFWKPVTVLTPQEVKKIDPTLHPKRLKDIGEDMTFYQTIIKTAQSHGAYPYRLTTKNKTFLAFPWEITVLWQKGQNLLNTVEVIKEKINSHFDVVSRDFKAIEKDVQTQKQTAATELVACLAAAKAISKKQDLTQYLLETDPEEQTSNPSSNP